MPTDDIPSPSPTNDLMSDRLRGELLAAISPTPALDQMYERARRELFAAIDLNRMLYSEESRAAVKHAQWYVRHLQAMIYRFSREAGQPEHAPAEPMMNLNTTRTT
jgi:hypothetical protein